MKAVKENKVYDVDEISKKDYLARGFDIVDDNGNVIERNPAATVPYREYEKLLEENAELRSENEKLRAEKKK